MPRPRPKSKNRQHRFSILKTFSSRKRKTAPEDFVGKFLFSVAAAIMTTLLTLAFAGQVNWESVVIAFLVALLVLVVYQQHK
ncbi:MAG: hypothetical protein HY741_14710 [Chloroflexi bacterium]|nr:hypothetical protein [Chloroflexota bacterium]